MEQIAQSRLQTLSLPAVVLVAGVALCQQHIGLLTNDAATVALMQAQGLDKIATSDTDFDCVPGVTRYAPG